MDVESETLPTPPSKPVISAYKFWLTFCVSCVVLQIFVDYINYDNMDMMKQMQVSVLNSRSQRNHLNSTPVLARYKLNMRTGNIKHMRIRKARPKSFYPVDHFDFPCMNEKYRFQKYCYVYGVSMRSDKKNLAALSLIKKDLCGGKRDKFVYLKNHYFHTFVLWISFF